MKKWHHRLAIVISMLPILIGSVFLTLVDKGTPYGLFLVFSGIMGIGFGMTMTLLTVLAQTSVSEQFTGVATSFFTLSRTIGQTIMISIFGLALNKTMDTQLESSVVPGATKDMMNELINPHTASGLPTELIGGLRDILYNSIHNVFLIGLFLVIVSYVLNYFQEKE